MRNDNLINKNAYGAVARLQPDRHFGFIRGDDGAEFFFHGTSVRFLRFEELHVGDRVKFEVRRMTDGNVVAKHVRPSTPPPEEPSFELGADYVGVLDFKHYRRYGFISVGGMRIHVHADNCVTPWDSLNDGDRVAFTYTVDERRRYTAHGVRRTS